MISFFLYAGVIIFGLIVGSFLNCVMWRLEKSESLLGRSYCPHCNHTLSWLDLFPVFSFLFLGGKCRYCREKISWQYPIVEIFTVFIFILIINYQFVVIRELSIYFLLSFLFLLYVASSLIVIFFYDLKHYIIPNKILFPAIAIAVVYRIYESLYYWNLLGNWSFKIDNFLYGGGYLLAVLIASGFFFVIYLVSQGRWIGFGDVKLAILLGLLLGWPHIVVGLFLAFFFGAIIGLGLIIFSKKGLKSQVPFAPFLIGGTFSALFWGEKIINWYLTFFRL